MLVDEKRLMKILLIDNYDSFTYNLLHLLEQFDDVEVEVVRNDQATSKKFDFYDGVVLSPGPGLPSESESLMHIARESIKSTKVLGVCLGHQALAEVFGAKLKNLSEVRHGIGLATNVIDRKDPLFKGIPGIFQSGRYHSWVIDPLSLPPEIIVTANDDERNIMAIRHVQLPVWGIQFHPESILTECGKSLVSNWLFA